MTALVKQALNYLTPAGVFVDFIQNQQSGIGGDALPANLVEWHLSKGVSRQARAI